jgi:hypothetical protein
MKKRFDIGDAETSRNRSSRRIHGKKRIVHLVFMVVPAFPSIIGSVRPIWARQWTFGGKFVSGIMIFAS